MNQQTYTHSERNDVKHAFLIFFLENRQNKLIGCHNDNNKPPQKHFSYIEFLLIFVKKPIPHMYKNKIDGIIIKLLNTLHI